MKKRRNWHRHDYTEIDDGSKPVQAGTRTFVQELRSRVFPRYGNLLWPKTIGECYLVKWRYLKQCFQSSGCNPIILKFLPFFSLYKWNRKYRHMASSRNKWAQFSWTIVFYMCTGSPCKSVFIVDLCPENLRHVEPCTGFLLLYSHCFSFPFTSSLLIFKPGCFS